MMEELYLRRTWRLRKVQTMPLSCRNALRRLVALVRQNNKQARGWSTCLFVGLLVFCSTCQRHELKVEQIVQPEYPVPARSGNIQGTVQIGVQIGIDGRVLWAHGSGANPYLVEAAEKNARQWIWGPFPAKFEFPYYHEMLYVYRLEGKALAVAPGPPTVKTYLPDRIEIISTPYYSDFGAVPSDSLPGTKK
jgi:hypothetical protein